MTLTIKRNRSGLAAIPRRIILGVAASGLAAGLAVAAPSSASAGSANVNMWSSFWQACGNYYCLYYYDNLSNKGWAPPSSSTPTIQGSYNVWPDGSLYYGITYAVRNTATSMGNNTTNCHVTTWYSPNWGGNWNWLDSGWAGNLNSSLRNNEASININTCR